MAWSDLTFTGCSVLTAGQMTQLQANFAALAQGAAGAPAFAPASLMWTGQASGAALNVSSRGAFRQLVVSDVASVNNLNVAGAFAPANLAVSGQSSLSGVDVSSRWVARTAIISEQGSAASLHVSSAVSAQKLLVLSDPSGTPDANTLYKGLIPKAWVRLNMATDVILDSFNISSITDGTTGFDTIVIDRDFANTNWALVGAAQLLGVTNCSFGAGTPTVGAAEFLTMREDLHTVVDATLVSALAFGDQ